MNTFPQVIRSPNLDFSDEPSDEAVLVGDMDSGYPFVNVLFTFDPRTFIFAMPCVPNADKLEIMAFYEANKGLDFYWHNKQDGIRYEVIFLSKPGCKLEGRGDLWRINLKLRQSSSNTS